MHHADYQSFDSQVRRPGAAGYQVKVLSARQLLYVELNNEMNNEMNNKLNNEMNNKLNNKLSRARQKKEDDLATIFFCVML